MLLATPNGVLDRLRIEESSRVAPGVLRLSIRRKPMTRFRPSQASTNARRLTRRSAIGLGAGLLAAPVISRSLLAQESTPESTPDQLPIQSTTVGEMPSAGGMRPGPVGQDSPLPTAANPSTPVQIQVEKAEIDAQIEILDIVNGVMQNPTGPWVVGWYRQTATLGEQGNAVLAGHVDFWNVGPSVFFNLRNLVQGDVITLIGEDGRSYDYAMEWSEVFDLEALTSGGLQDVVGPTDMPSVTLITCGGDFDYVNGEYLSRMVVRGTLIQPASTPESTPEG
jgi:sortase (surface protein transpeptidase)